MNPKKNYARPLAVCLTLCRKWSVLPVASVMVLSLGDGAPAASAQIEEWTPIYSGIEYATGKKTSPRLMRAFAMRIDLENPDVSIDITAPNNKRTSETDRQTTPDFRDATGVKVAINAHFYNSKGNSADLIGLAIQNGSTYSDDDPLTPWQLRFTSDNIASIVGFAGNPSGFHTAVAGNDLVLEKGTPRGDDGTPDPRTVAGLSQDGRYLIWVVIDGRQSDWSDGATYKDGGQWAKDFGAYNAINLDGGGSSTMVRDSDSGSVVLNRPSGGSPRSVGSNMGVYSKELNDRLDIVVRGESGRIYWRSFWRDRGDWSSWVDLGGNAKEKPGISSRGPGQLEVFIRGADDDIYFRAMQDYGQWDSWQSLGGPIASGVGAVSRSPDRINIVARGTDDTVQQKWWTPNGWSGFQSLGGATSMTPTISARDADNMDVFIRGAANDLNWRSWNSATGWGDWVALGGDLASGPSAVSRSPGRINIVARETGSNNVIQRWYIDGSWYGWENLGGGTLYEPGIAAWGPNRLDVVITGGAGDINHKFFDGSSWSGWGSLGTVGDGFTAGPEAVGGQW